jgi:hypothetical protein
MTNHRDDFEDMDLPTEGEVEPEPVEQPFLGRVLAWTTLALGALYIINPTAGFFELFPDNIPGIGNLDEAAVVFLMYGAMRYLGMRLPEFIERWARPPAQLPAPAERDTRSPSEIRRMTK